MKNQVKIVDSDFVQNDSYSISDLKDFSEKKLKKASKLIKGKVKVHPKKKFKSLIIDNVEESTELIVVSNRMMIFLKLLFIFIMFIVVLFILNNNLLDL